MLNNFLRPELERRRIKMKEMWFKQDGATPHMDRASVDVVRERFPGNIISRFGVLSSPSIDLSICAFLWSYLKFKVNFNKLRTINHLKIFIYQGIETVLNEIVKKAVQNFKERLQICDIKDFILLIFFSESS